MLHSVDHPQENALVRISDDCPVPGNDCPTAPWVRELKRGEVALFFFDRNSGELLKTDGTQPQSPLQRYCLVFSSMFHARLTARGARTLRGMVTALYDHKGRWLETFSRTGSERRHPGLGLALLLLNYPAMAIVGTLVLAIGAEIRSRLWHAAPMNWPAMRPEEIAGWVLVGTLIGGLIWGTVILARYKYVVWTGKPALQPMGSPGRERFYKNLAAKQPDRTLVPIEVTLRRCDFEWPSKADHDNWSSSLKDNGFRSVATVKMEELDNHIEWFLNDDLQLTASITHIPTRGMGMELTANYADGSSKSVCNRAYPGVDPYLRMLCKYLGTSATLQDLLVYARENFPVEGRRQPTEAEMPELFHRKWREYFEWRRSRGTTREEYKRIDEIRAARKREMLASGK